MLGHIDSGLSNPTLGGLEDEGRNFQDLVRNTKSKLNPVTLGDRYALKVFTLVL